MLSFLDGRTTHEIRASKDELSWGSNFSGEVCLVGEGNSRGMDFFGAGLWPTLPKTNSKRPWK